MIEKKIFYLTEKGLEKIKNEYEQLRKIRFSRARGETPGILESEDVNPEYLAFQEDMNFLEARLADLEHILKNFELIKPPLKAGRKEVRLGANVVVEIDGETDEFEIVGSLEANPSLGRISNESPVGHALLGHKIGEEVIVSSPVETVYKIKKIKYV